MGYRHSRPTQRYVVIRKQGVSPVRIVRHSLTKRKAESEAKFLQEQLEPRKDVRFEVRPEGWNRKKPYS